MAVEGGMSLIKYLLFGFNFVFFLIGLALIICGAVIESHFKEYFEVIGSDFNAPAALLISVGCIIFIIGFLGCCGALKENYCMMMTFAALLGVILVLELAAGFAAYNMKDKVDDVVTKNLEKSLDKYATANATRRAWDALQQHLECCGVNKGIADWDGKLDQGDYPESCCKDKDAAGCGTDVSAAFNDNCGDKLDNLVVDELVTITLTSMFVALIELIGIVFACLLARNIKAGYQSV